ncbi:hypothetical protein BDW02DRAFT_565033 [Decorospora gaudefroyi]|uniref:Uncharacterized protein n=1 Tax=Decorospora gaudefroyi TaxID=184978 RepID=A0A6A5KV46_9PLEO|nr:hypothetical protein BDW02DRAFT_565033 [Decorospora gaudefroyi]
MLRPRALFGIALLVFASLVFFWAALHSETFNPIPVHQVEELPRVSPDLSLSPPPSRGKEARLHLLIVATSSGLDLCRLLFSTTVLSYPPPVLIDWAGEGAFNATETHLAKIAGSLRYLENLAPSQDTDLVLVLDGFDVIFQLGPDVLLKRYFQEIAASNAELAKRFGSQHVREYNIYNSILFGPDKLCWPIDYSRPACWAVPPSPLHPDAFGPYTDKIMGDMPHARPRWLNSGTILGPVNDVRTMLRATQERINEKYDPAYELRNSDQMYLADLWGDQEFARVLSLGHFKEFHKSDWKPDWAEEISIPALEQGKRTEYHIGLDHRSALFQTMAGYRSYMAWIATNRLPLHSSQISVEPYRIDLPQDVLHARPPFASITNDSALSSKSWRDVRLGFNTVTGSTFPILHFTGDKTFRGRWWSRMWYFEHADRLRRAEAERKNDAIGTIDEVNWLKARPYESGKGDRKGEEAWSDSGQKFGWDELCGAHEEVLYSEYVEPPPEPESEPER